MCPAHKVGSLAWLLLRDQKEWSQPAPSLGPAVGCLGHIAEVSELCLALCLGVSRGWPVALFLVGDHVEGSSPLTLVLASLGSLEVALNSWPLCLILPALVRHPWGQTEFCLEKSMPRSNGSSSNNVAIASYRL